MLKDVTSHEREIFISNLSKQFSINISKSEANDEDLFEKAKHQVGDMHPNGKWVWTDLGNSRFDWRVAKGRKAVAAGQASTSDSDKTVTWDKSSSFNKKGSDENKLWDAWYEYQTTGDPSNMSKFRDILAKKFPNVSSWSQTSPNTGKSIITAKDDNGKEIASIDLSGNSIDIPKLQTFMDKCHKVVKSTTKYSPNMRKLIDAFRISSNKYTDPEKMSITTTPKGNWELRYDGKRVSVIGSLDIDRDEFDDLGITINSGNTSLSDREKLNLQQEYATLSHMIKKPSSKKNLDEFKARMKELEDMGLYIKQGKVYWK